MNNLKIRKASEKEYPLVAGLVIELLSEFNKVSGSMFLLDASALEQTTKTVINSEDFAAFIGFEGEQAVGLITITKGVAIYNGGDFGVITELYVDRSCRSKGIGKQLLEAAFGFARSKGWKKVEVGAPNKKDWSRSTDFYLRNGFEEKGPKLRIGIE